MKNYYKILNVDPLSSAEDIKRAYREQVKKYHPDVSKSSDAEQMIREINEAYSVLSSPLRRREHDNELKNILFSSQEPPKMNHKEEQPTRTKRRGEQFKPFRALFADKNTVYAILSFAAVCIIGITLVLVQYFAATSSDDHGIMPGMTTAEVLNMYGDPDSMEANKIVYDTAQIILSDGVVVHWYDAFEVLDIENDDIDDVSDVMIGETIERVFQRYGFPDTYAESFIVYGDIVIHYDHNKIVESVNKIS